MKFARAVFTIAGVSGLALLAPMYFLENRIAVEQPPAITHPEYFYGFIGVGLAWQVLFLTIARAPARYRAMMIPAVLEKLSFGLATALLYLNGRLAPQVFAMSLLDWLFAILFVLAFLKTAPE